VERKEHLFSDHVVLVHPILHSNEEEMSMWLRAHLYVLNRGVIAGELEFRVINFDALHSFNADEWAVLLQVTLLFNLVSISQQYFLQHHKLTVSFQLVLRCHSFFISHHHQLDVLFFFES